ncbi:MAG: protein phosphatase CheZ [Steroidobacteraceae bacterium]
MSETKTFQAEFGDIVARLSGALDAGNEGDFFAALDDAVRRRERGLFVELHKLTSDLQSALDRFSLDSRLVDLAEKEVPDARNRLEHVLKLTDEAAHRTMDLVERSGPLAERTARSAAAIVEQWQQFRARKIAVHDFRRMLESMDGFLASAPQDMEQVRGNLAEVLMAQGYQDISGQIIRGVMKLVSELEVALANLVRLSNPTGMRAPVVELDAQRRGYGPAVPGVDHGNVVNGQTDVDDLLSGLGM